MKKSLLILTAVTSIIVLSCSKNTNLNSGSSSLKQSVSTGVIAVNNAIGTISASKGYEVLSANSVAVKSATVYTDSVTLPSVAGIYDFQPDLLHTFDFFIPHRMFVKTGTSNLLIVNLPQKLVIQPRYLHDLYAPDSLLKNDFTITASDYYYYFNYVNEFDYRLNAGFTLDSVNIGNLNIIATASSPANYSYTSGYTFPGGYTIDVSSIASDTTVSVFTLSQNASALMKETVVATPPALGQGTGPVPEFRMRERLYILDIGNVEIRRGGGMDSIQVYLDGVLQKTAGARIIDSTGTNGSIFSRRDILLTFDDGTTENLSTLIDPAMTALKNLVNALQSMNFAKNIVDYIAIGIDYNIHQH
ncbi:MAG: hypothetical protein ABR974_06885 [Bacteroidales bacterium]